MQTQIVVSDSAKFEKGQELVVDCPNGQERIKILAVNLGSMGKLKGNFLVRLFKNIYIKIFKTCPATWFEWRGSTTLTVERI